MWDGDFPDNMVGWANIPYSGSASLLKLFYIMFMAHGKNLIVLLDARSLQETETNGGFLKSLKKVTTRTDIDHFMTFWPYKKTL